MPDQKPKSSQGKLDPNKQGVIPADQAEGERGTDKSVKVGRTPGQAEGDRDVVEEDIRSKERQGKL